MASVESYTKKDGTVMWRFQAYTAKNPLTGKQSKVKRSGYETQKEARLAGIRYEEKIHRKGYNENAFITFKNVYEDWFKLYKNTVRESSWVKTRDNFRLHILPKIGDKPIAKVTVKDCQAAIDDWFNEGYKKYHVFLNMTSKVFQYAIIQNMLYNDPTKKVIVPRHRDKPASTMKDNYYELEELKTFFSALHDFDNPKAYTLFRLLAFSGMRKGEALALQWSDIDYNAKTVTINKTLTRGDNARLFVNAPKTVESNRVINVDEKTLNILRQWRYLQRKEFEACLVTDKGPEQLVFTTEDNKYLEPTYPTKWLDWTVKQYNDNPDNKDNQLKRITVHGFRHTYASLAFESGLTPKEVQTQLGHRNIATTLDIYTTVTKSQNSKMASTFAGHVNI